MIKTALQYLVALSAANIITVDGREYSDKSLHPVRDPKPNELQINTLTGIADYLKHNPDLLGLERLIVHIEDPTTVKLFSVIDGPWEDRAPYLRANFKPNVFGYGQYKSVEDFIIGLQTFFVPSETVSKMVALVSSISQDTEATYTDDGMSQTVKAKSGIARMGNVEIPNPVMLAPYRTFLEIDQPESAFLFRVKRSDNGPQCALFAADGGNWNLYAIESIKVWLQEQLPEEVTIIA